MSDESKADDKQNPRDEQVRGAIRRHYAELAKTESPCCGGPESAPCNCQGSAFTGKSSSPPSEAVSVGAGCGNSVELAKLEPGMTVVDLGSGGGLDIFMAAEVVGPNGKAIGIDATPEMVHRARETAEKHSIENVEFRLGEIEHIPLENESADVVISNCVINLSPDKEQVLKEAHRILRRGGRLAVSDMVLLRPLPEGLRHDLTAWAVCIGGAILEDEYLEIMKKVGFSDAKVEDRVVLSSDQLRTMLSCAGSLWSGAEELSGLIASSRFSARKKS